ncbi:site-specific integrase [Streptomyces sp. NBC_00669]|uniref:tyrosine-type recombinase/integrase n=1 Tax=Streptomyces sp. NBC_00669 TaxID=2976011 RepID=UPI002E379669|nr:site-specific integrase [Streptomyces sp. NBC_00669]
MASVVPRIGKAGNVTSYQVKWHLGGPRSGPWQTERFTDETAAEIFRGEVEAAGHQWPAGWVKGKGYITQADGENADGDRFRFRVYATREIDNRTGIEEHYRQACYRDLEKWIFPTFGECDVRSVEHFSSDTIRPWVRQLEQTLVQRGQTPKLGRAKMRQMSPKTIRNLHGLLSSILEAAVKAEPPLRERNPCKLTTLPRTDDDGTSGEDGEDVEFLTPEEVDGVVSRLRRRSDQLLAIVKYGTGLRWGEIIALAPMCIPNEGQSGTLRVRRAWKKDGHGGYYIGTPKTKRSRRTLRVSATVVAALIELGLLSLDNKETLFFTGEAGQRLHYSSFHDRWNRAVKQAKKDGVLPREKHPTPHDLRHSHAAALISAGHSLTYVQRRLGHESIKTTSDTYGHLLPEADDAAMETIERSLRGGQAPTEVVLEAGADAIGGMVYVAQLDVPVGFRDQEVAREVVEQWHLDTGRPARLETWSTSWWRRSAPGGRNVLRDALPDRVWIVSAGPVLFQSDGEQVITGRADSEVSGRWVWEWDSRYTDEPAVSRVEWLPDGESLTVAEVWGTDEIAVRETFAQALEDARRVCRHTPFSTGPGGSGLVLA